jgi:hypothetical protein
MIDHRLSTPVVDFAVYKPAVDLAAAVRNFVAPSTVLVGTVCTAAAVVVVVVVVVVVGHN